jgi:FkbM family methyltransferase
MTQSIKGVTYYSHMGADLWVAETMQYRRDAYFLEFGALDGLTASNCAMLEKTLGWKGIAVEANPTYYPQVCANRSCITVNVALAKKSRESVEMIDVFGLSALRQHINVDGAQSVRERDKRGYVWIDTLNPTELLQRYSSAEHIEFLSLDIEGGEYEVIKAINFDYYRIALMAIEHSSNPKRQKLMRDFLLPKGYKVIQRHQDDWFYHPQNLERLQLPGQVFDPEKAFSVVEATFR